MRAASVRVHSFASGSSWWTAATAASTVLLIPLAPGCSRTRGRRPARPVCHSFDPAQGDQILGLDETLRVADLCSRVQRSHKPPRWDGWRNRRGPRSSVLWSGPSNGMGASPLVGDREHAVDVGIILPPGVAPEPLGDVARGARRAVHRADHGEVIPRPHPPIGPEEPLKVRGSITGRRGRLRRISIVTVEELGRDVVHVDPGPGSD